MPKTPADLSQLDALIRYSQTTHRTSAWHLKSVGGDQTTIELPPKAILNDQDALCHAAIAGLGVAQVPMPHALRYLESGQLIRLLPEWYTEHSVISLYFAAKKLMPAKTRVFVDFIVEKFRTERLSDKWSAI